MISLPFPPSSLSGHAKGNWYGKSSVTKKWRQMACEAAKAAGYIVPEDGDISVHVTFYPPDRRGDRVNFPNRCKPIFDGIADALGVNDSRFVPHFYFCAPTKPGRVEVVLSIPGIHSAPFYTSDAKVITGLSPNEMEAT